MTSIFAQSQHEIPEWIKNNVKWWTEGTIDDDTFVSGIEFLISKGIVDVTTTQKTASPPDEIPSWIRTNAAWWVNGLTSNSDFIKGIEFLVNSGIIKVQQTTQRNIDSTSLEFDTEENNNPIYDHPVSCSGSAQCITGTVTSIIDGDTIKTDGQSIRFALASAPELDESGGIESRNFIDTICPVGSTVLVDEDDGQTGGSYGRIIGVIYCNGFNLNEELLDANLGYLSSAFCSKSEFSSHYWAQKHGCQSTFESKASTKSSETIENCDSSYPDFCIPSPPPDLDCKDIPQKRFTVLQPDPHRFDGDKDGIGCES